jgi:hypothetical protein
MHIRSRILKIDFINLSLSGQHMNLIVISKANHTVNDTSK